MGSFRGILYFRYRPNRAYSMRLFFFPRAKIGAGCTRPLTDVVLDLRQRRTAVNGIRRRRDQRQVTRGRIDEVAVEARREIVVQFGFAAFEPNFAVDEIVGDIGLRCAGADANAATPVAFRPPDAVVINLDAAGVP